MLTIGQEFALDSGLESRGDGLVRIKYVMSATGVQNYLIGGKVKRVLKTEEEFSNEEYLRSARSVPLSVEHSGGMLSTNDEQFVVGLSDDRTPEFDSKTGHIKHAGTLFSAKGIKLVSSKKVRGVSAGYHTQYVENGGTWTAPDGSKHEYDLIQTQNRVNHVTLTRNPRVKSALIALDSDAAIWVPNEDDMSDETKETIAKLGDGETVDTAALDSLRSALDAAEKQNETLQAELAELNEKLGAAQAALDAAPSIETLQEAHKARIELAAAVADSCGIDLLDLVKLETASDVYRAALSKLGHEVAQDASEDYIRGVYSVASQAKPKAEEKKSAAAALKNVEPKVEEVSAQDAMYKLTFADMERSKKGDN